MNTVGLSKLLAFVLAFATLQAKPAVDNATRDIVQTYNFDPSKMSFNEQAKLAPNLGDLWDRFDKEPETYREALRSLLRKDGQREMLYCDGGMLFLKNVTEPTDKELGLQSVKKCSLAEIQHTPYFYTMHALAGAGSDPFELQLKILTKPRFQVFIPEHALTLGQNYSFLYPLLVQDETRYTARLIETTKAEKDTTALKTLVLALYYSALPEAESSIHSMSQEKTVPAVARELAKQIEDTIDEARKASTDNVRELAKQLNVAPDAAEKELRDGRRKRMRDISDEALVGSPGTELEFAL